MAVLPQGLQVAQKEAQIRLLEGRLRQTDVTGSSQNHAILDALREKAESHPELQALIHNVQQGGRRAGASSGQVCCPWGEVPACAGPPGNTWRAHGWDQRAQGCPKGDAGWERVLQPPHNREKEQVPTPSCPGCPLRHAAQSGLARRGPLCATDGPSLSCTENGYTSTDEEVSEFSLASDGR